MPEYFYNNNPVPESQLLRLSEEQGMSLDEFLEFMPDITVEEPEVEQPEVESDDDSLEQPNIDEIKEISKTDSRLIALEALQISAPTPSAKIGYGIAQGAYGFFSNLFSDDVEVE